MPFPRMYADTDLLPVEQTSVRGGGSYFQRTVLQSNGVCVFRFMLHVFSAVARVGCLLLFLLEMFMNVSVIHVHPTTCICSVSLFH